MRRTMLWWALSALFMVCTGSWLGAQSVIFSPAQAEEPELPGLILATDAARQYPSFERYFHLGKAELNRYALEQSRYGQVHRGEAVLIFVTEDFLHTKQVKYEGKGDREDAVNVLKLNAYRRFYTGIYPYTVMTSVFSPVRPKLEPPLKITFSATEWCGQAFTQLNRRADGFHIEERSYFEGEGDRNHVLPETILEDELLVRLRKDPNALPTGAVNVLPSFLHLRLDHKPVQAQKASASNGAPRDGKRVYRLSYESGRKVEFTYEQKFPHRVLEFREAQPGQPETHATLTRSILLPYWEKHGVEDARYRKALGLEE